MAVNKVVYDGETLIDLTSDDVTAETLAEGVTAHDASGNPIVGVAPTDAVRYAAAQSLTEEQQAQARENIGAADAEHTHAGYAASDHTHSEYAAANHSHSGYAAANHTHSEYPGIEIGSYAGTTSSTKAGSLSLSFAHTPKLLIITAAGMIPIILRQGQTGYVYETASAIYAVSCTLSGATLTVGNIGPNAGGAAAALNASGTTYYYTVIY